MARVYWTLNRGQTEFQATISVGSDPSKNVEIVVDTAASMSRAEVVQAIEMLLANIVKGKWPAA